MNNKKGLRSNLLIYEDLADRERILKEVNELFEEEANSVLKKCKLLSKTTTMTFQEALDKEIEKLNKFNLDNPSILWYNGYTKDRRVCFLCINKKKVTQPNARKLHPHTPTL